METKTCKRCQETKPFGAFSPDKRARDGLYSSCRDCTNKARSVKDMLRARLKHFYGLSLSEFEQMVLDQGGVCKICKKECPSGQRLSVDHCHETGKVRGLLCRGCNAHLGRIEMYKKDPKPWDDYLSAY